MNDSVLEMDLAIGNVERSEELGVSSRVKDVAHGEDEVMMQIV
jgi:hypothetical protein